jgi:hypothetical protein
VSTENCTILPLLPPTNSSSGTQAKNIQLEEGKSSSKWLLKLGPGVESGGIVRTYPLDSSAIGMVVRGRYAPPFFKDLCSKTENDDIDVTFLPLLPSTNSSSGPQANNIQLEE